VYVCARAQGAQLYQMATGTKGKKHGDMRGKGSGIGVWGVGAGCGVGVGLGCGV